VAPGCGPDDVISVGERLRLALLEQPVQISRGAIELSASFGVISRAELDQVDAEALIQAADEALYQAKASGRNCVRVADPAPSVVGIETPLSVSGCASATE
jgi:diguanylate cyclase (GGDEF)-like protein